MIDAAQVAKTCGVGRLFLFHHDPAHADEMVEEMAELARSHFAATEPAREGKRVWFGEGASCT
jgi:ribonuclease BN (tRNA processing enzyme)